MKVIFDEVYLEHDNPLHIENAGRLSLILEELSSKDFIKPENGEKSLSLCHSADYVSRIRKLKGSGFIPEANLSSLYDDETGDTYYNEKTFKAACYAAGGAVKASERQGFALVRPPGHHARKNRAAGLCIFNNMAIAAKRLSGQGKKTAILDIDCHHGDGTQELVEGDDNVLFCSFHQSPFYPGSGLRDEGNAVNIPLPAGSGDDVVIRKLEEKFVPRLEDFGADFIGVSAGFDSYYKDKTPELGNSLNVTEKTYAWVADLLSSYKKFFVLEGGYKPESVREGVLFFLSRF
jgi:acetoin utilization deacetylase AcuC-like enzyme